MHSAQTIISEADLEEAKADIAIFVVSRMAGEDADRSLIGGDYYLSKEEKENFKILSENYEKVIVLLNVGAPCNNY